MQLTRVDENPNSYFTKITESQQALKGKALAPLQLGGKEVAVSIFGFARQLWVRYDNEQKLLPFAFTDKGLRLLTPFAIGSDTLRTLELNADKTAVTTQDGKQTSSLYTGTYDLSEQYTILSYASSATAGTDALNLFTQVQETQQGDVYPGSFGTDVYFGRTSAMMPKISLFFQITYWLDKSWGELLHGLHVDLRTALAVPHDAHHPEGYLLALRSPRLRLVLAVCHETLALFHRADLG